MFHYSLDIRYFKSSRRRKYIIVTIAVKISNIVERNNEYEIHATVTLTHQKNLSYGDKPTGN